LSSFVVLCVYVENNNLNGVIPDELGALPQLTSLKLPRNNLVGAIPSRMIGKLAKLTLLDLSDNELSGELPGSFANLMQLQSLHLGINHLHGSLPIVLQGLYFNLRQLDLSDNKFIGTIDVLSKLVRLEHLNLRFNDFSGTIPTEIGGKLSFLRVFQADFNKFSGTFPFSSFPPQGNLSQVTVGSNSLFTRGPFPLEEIRQLGSIVDLDLSHTGLNGTIPNTIGTVLSGLRELVLERNSLTGSIPESIGGLGTSLRVLGLGENSLTGPVPSSIANLTQLVSLRLGFNDLNGTLSSSLKNFLSSIPVLTLQENHFTRRSIRLKLFDWGRKCPSHPTHSTGDSNSCSIFFTFFVDQSVYTHHPCTRYANTYFEERYEFMIVIHIPPL
jgi:Leucine-rich repeat (LRR) protein